MYKGFSPEDIQRLKQNIFNYARDGMAISIFAMLWNLDRSIIDEVLNHFTREDGQITTPLIIAARTGEEKVVHVLLNNFNVEVEQTGTVKFDGYVIEKATPLWCAAGAGHFGIVKLLIEHDADVNHPTQTNSTPLRAACFEGRLDIVKYLIQCKADINIANKYNNTCLMISSYKGHLDVVSYLLSQGADPDCVAHCGATALHFAAECGHLRLVGGLVKSNASMLKNEHGMTPLLVAAECGKSHIVDYFVSLTTCSRQDRVDGLELLGASYANDKENYDIDKAYLYLREAMEERYRNPRKVLKKPTSVPIRAYENRVECQTLAELEGIRGDTVSLHMESLAIRERILGSNNPEVPHPVIFRGAVFADSARFDRCIALWLHAMELRQHNNRTISKDLLRFSQVFSQMVHLGVNLDIKHCEEVFRHAVTELERDQNRISAGQDDKDSYSEIYQSNIHTCLYIIVIVLKISANAETEQFHILVYNFLCLKPLLKNGYTPLHMAVDSSTLVDEFHVSDVVTFPNAPLASLLIKCGANVNVCDKLGNTPMHVIVKYNNPINDFETLHQIMVTLIKHEAHLDICNLERKIPMDCTTTGVAEVILRTYNHISLKCIAAKAIRKNSVQYRNIIPSFLEEFVAVH